MSEIEKGLRAIHKALLDQSKILQQIRDQLSYQEAEPRPAKKVGE